MRARVCTLLLNLVKVTLATAATVCLYGFFLLMISSPSPSPPDNHAGHAIGWILVPALYAVAAFLVSILSGVLWTRDRWIVRPAAIIPVIWIVYYLIRGLLQLLKEGPYSEVSLYLRIIMLPAVCTGVIVFLFSPLFHRCGRFFRETTVPALLGVAAGFWARVHH
jgi:hypothetical protein